LSKLKPRREREQTQCRREAVDNKVNAQLEHQLLDQETLKKYQDEEDQARREGMSRHIKAKHSFSYPQCQKEEVVLESPTKVFQYTKQHNTGQ
jgi:hypothetical protein